jgi:Fe2+ or Zn2+ uptake regulation protein
VARPAGQLTVNRKLVLEEIRSRDDHPAAADIFAAVRRRRPKISLGSVYKTLQFLTDSGYVSEFHFSDELARYDRNTKRHDHALCRKCGRLADVEVEIPEAAVEQAAGPLGFRVDRHHVELIGTCNLCQ